MKVHMFLAGVIALAGITAATAGTPNPAATRRYIDHAWTTLTRSMQECRALVDKHIPGASVVYMPHGVQAPETLVASAKRCKVELRNLPESIQRLGSFNPQNLSKQGLLYLPRPYVVPGGAFNAMYGWDSYFIVLGLVADNRAALALDMVDNQLYEVRYYGAVLNANRTYYLTRSQPPFLSAMMMAVLSDSASFPNVAARRAWLERAYPLVVKNYDVWARKPHLAGDTGLARYFDFGHGPVPEVPADYYVDVIRWLISHPAQDPGYLVKSPQRPDAAQIAALKETSCDVTQSKTCADAWYDGYRLSAAYYLGDRAMRESGFDTDFHFGPWAGSTEQFAGVGLNSLLYRYARDLHDFAQQLGKTTDAQRWAAAAAARKEAMNKYLWHPQQGRYMDYNFVTGRASDDPYITMFYPLWAGAASHAQAQAVRGQLSYFERRGGLATSTRVSGAQWDAPNGWAPTNWLAVDGLNRYGFHSDARRIACKFTGTIDRSFATSGAIVEKYNMYMGNADVNVTAGYRQNMVGFGWTNGVYLRMQALIKADGGCHPASSNDGMAP